MKLRVFVFPILVCLIILYFLQEQWFLAQAEESFAIKSSFMGLIMLSLIYDCCHTWIIVSINPLLHEKNEPGNSAKKIFCRPVKLTPYPKTVESIDLFMQDYI